MSNLNKSTNSIDILITPHKSPVKQNARALYIENGGQEVRQEEDRLRQEWGKTQIVKPHSTPTLQTCDDDNGFPLIVTPLRDSVHSMNSLTSSGTHLGVTILPRCDSLIASNKGKEPLKGETKVKNNF